MTGASAIAIHNCAIALHHDAIAEASCDFFLVGPNSNACAQGALSSNRLTNSGEFAMPRHVEDAAVLGGLAIVFIWTYVVLPLAFFHT
jgi:hypothetical protein